MENKDDLNLLLKAFYYDNSNFEMLYDGLILNFDNDLNLKFLHYLIFYYFQ